MNKNRHSLLLFSNLETWYLRVGQGSSKLQLLDQNQPTTWFWKYRFFWNTATFVIYLLAVAVFMLHQQNWATATEMRWPTKAKIFIIWIFTKKDLSTSDLDSCGKKKVVFLLFKWSLPRTEVLVFRVKHNSHITNKRATWLKMLCWARLFLFIFYVISSFSALLISFSYCEELITELENGGVVQRHPVFLSQYFLRPRRCLCSSSVVWFS